jgi:hypothetical protein
MTADDKRDSDRYGGYYLVFDEPMRARAVEKDIFESDEFTDAMSIPDWSMNTKEIFLITLSKGEIFGAALASQGEVIASHKVRVHFHHIIKFAPAIALVVINRKIRDRLIYYQAQTSQGVGKRIPEDLWEELMGILAKQRPDSASDLDKLHKLRKAQVRDTQSEEYMSIESQARQQIHDSKNIALRIAGFDPHVLLAENNKAEAPFLKGINIVHPSEDMMIQRDMAVFGDWEMRTLPVVQAVEFRKRDHKLTVVNANRRPLEQTFGVDLIYYNHVYDAYVMVQYKRALDEAKGFVYRPDSNYKKELDRMRTWRKELYLDESCAKSSSYRLSNEFFYWKLCPEFIEVDINSTNMIDGSYYPLDLWLLWADSDESIGPRNGRRFEASARHFSNSLFIDLMHYGWIGSRNLQSDRICEIVHEALEKNRAVTLAANLSMM